MTYTPENLTRWTMPDSYFGATWEEYYGAGAGQHRDSDALTRSNFICLLKALGGESDTVMVIREGHWAVGWVEWIAIHQGDEKSLRIADDIAAALEDYPVVDESHWSDLENEEAQGVWTQCYDDSQRLEYVRKFRNQFDFRDYADLIGCIKGKWFNGYASELLA